jgi:hypothetical protein
LRSAPGELKPTGTLVVDPDELLAVIGRPRFVKHLVA